MKKSRGASIILKTMAAVIVTPIVLIWAVCAMLYVPPVQRYVTKKIEKEVAQNSDFRISVGSVALTFPFNLAIKDFHLTKEGKSIVKGEKAGISIALRPLFNGEVEVNYIQIEHTSIDTQELIEGTRIAGNIEHFRSVARNIDLAKKEADIRQLHLNGAQIDIHIDSNKSEEENTPTTAKWIINLRKGNIENVKVAITMPQESTEIVADIEKLVAKEANANIADNSYSLKSLAIEKSSASYNHGTLTREEAPLQHIEINDINIVGDNFAYTPHSHTANIEQFSMSQQEGIKITHGTLIIAGDDSHTIIEKGFIKSANGSCFDGKASILHKTSSAARRETMQLTATAHVNKQDLAGFITAEQANTLAAMPDSLIDANIKFHSSLEKAIIDTLSVSIPTVATLQAQGTIANINKEKPLADIDIDATIFNGNRFTGTTNTTPPTPLSISGKAQMRGTLLTTGLYINGKGGGKINAMYEMEQDFYDARIELNKFDIKSSIATIPVQNITMRASISGKGTDIFAPQTYYQLFSTIDTLHYGGYMINDVTMSAFQANSLSFISLISNNPNTQLSLTTNTHIKKTEITNNTELKIKNIALKELGISEQEASAGMNINWEAQSNFKEKHSLKLKGSDIVIKTEQKRYAPSNVEIDFSTAPGASHLIAKNGDLSISGTLASGHEQLFAQLDKIKEMFRQTRYSEKNIYYAHDFEKALPAFSFDAACGTNNILHNYIAMNDIDFKSIAVKCNIDSVNGIRARGAIHDLKTTDAKLDTIRLSINQDGENIKYFAGVRSSAITQEKEKQSFQAALYGNLLKDTLNTHFTFRNNTRANDTNIQLKTLLMPEGLNIHILPQTKILGEEFEINRNNHIEIGKNKAVKANLRATDRHNSGLHLYTIDDSTAMHDITLELFNVNLEKLTSALPFTPNIGGTLYSDIHYRNEDNNIILSCDITTDSTSYEGKYIGNEMAEFVYLPNSDGHHLLSLQMYHDEKEYLRINGDYHDDGNIDGNATLTKLPLKVINTFVQESDLNTNGYINGRLSLSGPLDDIKSNGYIQFDSVHIDAPLLGSQMRLVDDKVNIENSKIKFNDFKIYAKGDAPFVTNGEIDITHITNPTFNLRMQAKNYELVNAARQKKSIVYGKLFLDINALISGPMNALRLYGTSTILGNTNVTYVMPESSIATGNEFDGLVEFVNFNDSTPKNTTDSSADLGNINMSMALIIEEGAWINADFNSSRDSYINLQGGGQLNMGYTSEAGISLTGRYTLNNGEMKYHLPIIPLKTFHISPGSYVNWTGDLMNPTLNITALERIMAPVAIDGGKSEAVAFDVGLVLSNSLDNMGLTFTMKAPENATIQDELNSLDTETLNKYAVTMLVTGAYVGNNGGITVSNALTSFLDAKINDIAGDATKSVSINVGITDIENKESGGSYTNYSFSLAKRFWNDRLTIVIGGEVNSGDKPEEEQSFINNVSLEWRLTATGNRYLRIFYDKNYESILEGEITETGVGYVYKRKLNNLSELLFIKKQKERTEANRNKKQDK